MLPDPLGPVLAWLAFSGVLSCLLTGVFTQYARNRGMLDIPGDRHSHTAPTPRGGGAGLVLALVIASLAHGPDSPAFGFWLGCILPGTAVIALVGWWDDHSSLAAWPRFVVQVLVCLYLLWCLRSAGMLTGLVAAGMAMAYLLWMINLYNFMDGSNGMAGFQGVFAGGALAWLFTLAGEPGLALVSALVAAACVGFLPWNLGRARVFMGDVGSGTLGFAIASLVLFGTLNGSLSLPVAWLVMALFFCDASLTLMSRVIRRERWYTAHKQHVYQRLIARGWSHGSVLALYQAVNLVLVTPAIAVAVNFPAFALVAASAATLALALGWITLKNKLECSP